LTLSLKERGNYYTAARVGSILARRSYKINYAPQHKKRLPEMEGAAVVGNGFIPASPVGTYTRTYDSVRTGELRVLI